MRHAFKTALLSLSTATALLTAPAAQAADTYILDPHHTNIVWHADHFGFSTQSGKFPLVNGTLLLDEADPAKSKIQVNLDTAKLATGDAKFDEHLKSKDFFDVATYPLANFSSTKVTKTGESTAQVEGTLTLHGVSRQIVLDVTLNKKGDNPITNKASVGFTATTTIKRSDFGISYALPGVSDEVKLDIAAEAAKK